MKLVLVYNMYAVTRFACVVGLFQIGVMVCSSKLRDTCAIIFLWDHM